MARIAFSVLSKSGASPITRAIRNCQMPLWRADTRPTPPRNITVESGSGLSADFDLKEYSRPLIESVNRELHKLIPLSEEKIEEAMRYSVMEGGKSIAKGGGSMGMVGGQYMDLASAGTPSVDPALVEYIHRHKSALMAEISVVGGSDEEVERLRAYGRGVGLAYQIVDDMLDQSSTTEELGKTAGKDKRADKATYPKLYGMQKCREIVLQLAQEAQQCISQFNPLQAAPLLSFAQYVIARNF